MLSCDLVQGEVSEDCGEVDVDASSYACELPVDDAGLKRLVSFRGQPAKHGAWPGITESKRSIAVGSFASEINFDSLE